MLSFFPRGVLDEILNLIESVSEGFPSYSYISSLIQSAYFLIGVGRFRILGAQGLEYWEGEGQGGPNSWQAHVVVTTSM